MTNADLEQRLSECAESFRKRIGELSEQAGKPALAVYKLWREYAQVCRDGDQSAILGEFETWYADHLNPPAFTLQAYTTGLGWADISHHANKDTACGASSRLVQDKSAWIDGKPGQTRIVAYADRRAK